MPSYLFIANKLLLFKGNTRITDVHDTLVYEARGKLAFFSPTWTIFQGGKQVAKVRRRLFALGPTWEVRSTLGNFLIRRKLLAISLQMVVEGGPYDGCAINGTIWDQQFAIERGGATLAHATGKLLSLRDRLTLQIQSENTSDQLFTVVAMVTLQLLRKSEDDGVPDMLSIVNIVD